MRYLSLVFNTLFVYNSISKRCLFDDVRRIVLTKFTSGSVLEAITLRISWTCALDAQAVGGFCTVGVFVTEEVFHGAGTDSVVHIWGRQRAHARSSIFSQSKHRTEDRSQRCEDWPMIELIGQNWTNLGLFKIS